MIFGVVVVVLYVVLGVVEFVVGLLLFVWYTRVRL